MSIEILSFELIGAIFFERLFWKFYSNEIENKVLKLKDERLKCIIVVPMSIGARNPSI